MPPNPEQHEMDFGDQTDPDEEEVSRKIIDPASGKEIGAKIDDDPPDPKSADRSGWY